MGLPSACNGVYATAAVVDVVFSEAQGFVFVGLIGLVGFLVPVLFEMVQMIIPYRSFNINDMVANGVGVMLGLLPAVLVWRRIMP